MSFQETSSRKQHGSEGNSVPSVTSPFKSLHNKAMLVKLTCRAPNLSRRDAQAESFVQDKLKDTSLTVSSQLFRGKENAVRQLLNDAGGVYAYHTSHTMPWTDRGPRLLPVSQYHVYSEKMRKLIRSLENRAVKLLPDYSRYVQADIAARGERAKLEDYPSQEAFKASLAFDFFFSPLPDAQHFLFDIDKEDADALKRSIEDAGVAARDHVYSQLHDPLLHLLKRLRVKIGKEGSIFRDASLTNIVEACTLAESLALGDSELLDTAAELRKAIRPLVLNPEELRESPASRAKAVKHLEEVAAKMSFLSSGE